MKVVIIGAGVTGLTVAYLLCRQGVEVEIHEAAAAEGGLAGTFQSGEFWFDYGPHEFVTSNPALVALLQEVCGPDLLTVPKKTAQYFNGRFVRYPFEILDVLRMMPLRRTFKAGVEVLFGRMRNLVKRPTDRSFEEWTMARFGATFYRHYFGPYTRKVWGVAPAEIDARTAAHRISVDSLWDLLKKTISFRFFGGERRDRIHSELWREFLYTRHGAGTLQRHLRQRIESLGGRFHFGHRLSAVEVEGSRATVAHFEGGHRTSGFDSLVSTIALPEILRLTLGQKAQPLLEQNMLPFRGMVFVFLRINRPQVTEHHWVYFPEQEIPFQRWTEFSHFQAEMTPKGTTSLALEVAANPGQPGYDAPDGEIAERCIQAIVDLSLLKREEVLGYDVVRTRHAYPIQVIGYHEKARALLDALATVENVVSVGRQGLFRYCNQNECMEMAMDVVPELMRGARSIVYTSEGTWRGADITERKPAG